MFVFIILSSAEFLYTEKSHVRTLKVLLIKFYTTWPTDLIDLRDELMPKLEDIIDIHRTEHSIAFAVLIQYYLNSLFTSLAVSLR